MALAEPLEKNILQIFYAGLATTGDKLLHIRKQGDVLRRITKRQAASDISQCLRALHAHDFSAESRITFQAASSYCMWVTEWATIANRSVAVIVPDNFTLPDLVGIVKESKSKIAVVDALTTAKALADASASIPDLKYILCFEGSAQAALPIRSWEEFIESGTDLADRSGAAIRSISAKDTAILFYHKDEASHVQATRYTHELLLLHTQRIDELLGNSATIHNDEIVLSIVAWEHIAGHLLTVYMPVIKEAAVEITEEKVTSKLFNIRPHIIIGRGLDFDIIKQNIIEHLKQQGPGAYKELEMALALGKAKYETGKLNPWQRLGYALLRQTIFKEVKEYLGERLRLYISVDDAVRYETQLFFETFGIELVELPPEILSLS